MKFLNKALHFLPPLFFIIAAVLVHRQLQIHPMSEIRESIASIPKSIILISIGLTLLNYLILCLYDGLALRYASQKVSAWRIILASFISYAISNNTGHALISGTSVRYRFYTSWGVPGWEILKISLFLAITFIVGTMTLEVITVALLPRDYFAHINAPAHFIYGLTAFCAVGLIAYWVAVLLRHPVTFGDVRVEFPAPILALKQTIISSLDLVLAAAILYLFLQSHMDLPFHSFLAIYVLALIAGLVSQVPGGIGVFESTFLLLAGSQYPASDIFASLIVYRIIYYFMPLLIAGIGLFAYEARMHSEKLIKKREQISKILGFIIPPVFAMLLLLSGVMLLVSGAMPPFADNIQLLNHIETLPLLEISHLMGSIIGVCLLFMARGIFLRLDAAYFGVLVLLALGTVVSMLKGLDWREASILATLFILFLPTHGYFRRKSPLSQMSLPIGWIALIALIMMATAWVGFYSYKHVDYTDDLWFQFTFGGDASRFLRALVLSGAVCTAFILYNIFRVARPRLKNTLTDSDLVDLSKLAQSSDDTSGFLSLLQDKTILWHESRKAFIMYRTTSRYWIAMGDPVGDASLFNELLWSFRENADNYGAKIVFYEVSKKYLPLYLDLGLILLKIGEEARIPLSDFNLEGGKREKQRKTRNKYSKLGYVVRLLTPEELETTLPTLRKISDSWLALKKAREKSFSLGFFDEDYLRRTKVAVVEKDGQILAFANVWMLDNKEEITVDIMRYAVDAPPNMMEYLFVELILWAKQENYEWFNLGMAPLSGLESHPLAPMWHKIGLLVFRHGEEFYNFEGLQAYKDKFEPVWTPHYIAVPPGLHVPVILLRIASLISGNIKGIFKKS